MDIYYFKNVTVVCFSIITLFSSLYADQNESKIFLEKYGQVDIVKIEDDIFQPRDKLDLNLTQDINTSKYRSFSKKIDKQDNSSEEVKKLVTHLHSNEMMRKVIEAKKYILDDLDMNMSDYQSSDSIANPKDVFSTKRYFLCISSSMPKELIQNYLAQIENGDVQIEVVLNGFIGGIKKIKKTIAFINSVMMKNKKEIFEVSVQINPKIFMNYNIKRVPALVFDPSFNQDLLNQSPYKDNHSNKFIVVYGAASLKSLMNEVKEKIGE